MLGNLVRPNYLESSNGVWPYSYDECGVSTEAQEVQQAQRYNKCDDPKGAGRGGPEIDIIEAQPGGFSLVYDSVEFADGTVQEYTIRRPLISSSLQVAPGVHPQLRPTTPNFPQPGQWYPDLYPMGGPAYNFEGLDLNTNATTLSAQQEDNERPPRMINNYWYGQVRTVSSHDGRDIQNGCVCVYTCMMG